MRGIKDFHLSQQLYITDISPGYKGIYSPFGHHVAFLWDEALENLQNRKFSSIYPTVIEYLLKNNILVRKGFEEEWLKKLAKPTSVKINSMFLVVTLNCNMGCRYCAVIENIDNSNRLKEMMSLEVGKRALSVFLQQLTKSKPDDARITFYGGEPLMNKDLLKKLIPIIGNSTYIGQKKPIEMVVITNGLKYDKQLTEIFKKHNVGICISLDGKKEHQDITRVTRYNEKSTFKKVIKNFKKYQDEGLTMGISTALGQHNSFALNEICDFYSKELKPSFVEFQIPYQVSHESNDLWVSTDKITELLMDAYATLQKNDIVEGLAYRRLIKFKTGRVHLRDCGASGSQLVVAPDGMVGPCHSLVGTRTFFSNNVLEKNCDPSKIASFVEWAKRYPLLMKDCLSCPFITLCGGGCIYNSFISTGSVWNKDPQVCSYIKGMIDWILKRLWIESKFCTVNDVDSMIKK